MSKKLNLLLTILILVLCIGAIFKIYLKNKNNNNAKNKTNLIVGTSADFPPFSFRDKNDDITGFDIDVIKEISKRTNIPIEIVDRPFSLLIPQIQIGQIDIIAAGMTPTPEREKNLRFTKSHFIGDPLVMVTLKDKMPKSVEDLKGKDVIVNTGYTAEMFMSKVPKVNLIRLPKVVDAIIALKNNKAYAFVTAKQPLQPFIHQDKNTFNIAEIEGASDNSALGISKTLPRNIFAKIEKALEDMEIDGTLVKLKQKWKLK